MDLPPEFIYDHTNLSKNYSSLLDPKSVVMSVNEIAHTAAKYVFSSSIVAMEILVIYLDPCVNKLFYDK